MGLGSVLYSFRRAECSSGGRVSHFLFLFLAIVVQVFMRGRPGAFGGFRDIFCKTSFPFFIFIYYFCFFYFCFYYFGFYFWDAALRP
jgi:hypothetical protein